MNALEHNQFTQTWAATAHKLPKPKAILVISAHWYLDHVAVTAMPKPKLIHDFYGFPEQLNRFAYPAVGDVELAKQVAALLSPEPVRLDYDSWGLDHGAWSVLAPMYPDADIPVVQLSVSTKLSFDQHLALGAKLAPLRAQGVLILASGNVVHNLGLMRPVSYSWAQSFDEEVRQLMLTQPQELTKVPNSENYRLAVPTPEHFIPLLYLAGLAQQPGQTVEIITEGMLLGSIAMTSYQLSGQ